MYYSHILIELKNLITYNLPYKSIKTNMKTKHRSPKSLGTIIYNY